jgi:hypothetical protein
MIEIGLEASGATLNCNNRLPMPYCESLASTIKAKEPLTAGTPEITPVLEFNDKPAGRAPCVIQNLNGGNPPATRKVEVNA